MADTKIEDEKNFKSLRYAKEVKPENAQSQDLVIMQETKNYQIRFQMYQGGGHPKVSIRRFFENKNTGVYTPKRFEGISVSIHMLDEFIEAAIEAKKKVIEIPWVKIDA